jgi:hypothetical protein
MDLKKASEIVFPLSIPTAVGICATSKHSDGFIVAAKDEKATPPVTATLTLTNS